MENFVNQTDQRWKMGGKLLFSMENEGNQTHPNINSEDINRCE